MMKRCQKGKSCGDTCISRLKVCLSDLHGVGEDMNSMSKSIQSGVNRSNPPNGHRLSSSPLSGQAHGPGVKAAEKAIEALSGSTPGSQIKEIKGELDASKINWGAALGREATFDAAGSSGVFIGVPPKSLVGGFETRFPEGVGVKYGVVKRDEVEILKLAGESGAGPRMISAKIVEGGQGLGAVAMERVSGQPLIKALSDGEVTKEKMFDTYITGIAKLHRVGIEHGDAHLGNVIYNPQGGGKFIDFGLSQKSPYHALWEALSLSNNQLSHYQGFEDGITGPVATKLKGNLKRLENSGKLNRFYSIVEGDEGDHKAFILSAIKDLYKGI